MAKQYFFSYTEEVDAIIQKTTLTRSINLKNITLSRWSNKDLLSLKALLDKNQEITP